ncbi:DUF805 domain-containing protein [Halomonas litopenaei]|uniref:DUF805 domain-containing protein n=1 Tax=Halomonas litopenaei TaxID=2109328 RepID=UPI001A906EE3|nr:DUF805 domain-containing protein [Halomonas litopenaei]MBN8413961.1 DUF805 domain-containing protein [Halomonas litopenaei]
MSTDQEKVTSPQATSETSQPPVSNTDSEHGSAMTQHGFEKKTRWWSTRGRIGRVTYFNRTTLASLMVNGPYIGAVAYAVTTQSAAAEAILGTVLLLTIVLSIPLTVFWTLQAKRRINDQNRSGWLLLLALVPLVNLAIFIMLYCVKGSSGENRYGPAPEPPTSSGMTLSWCLLGLILLPFLVPLGVLL